MKLRMICENIRKTEFYDFYALAYVYQDLKTSTGYDPAYKKEVEHTLRDLAEYIFTDHITQLTQLVSGRLLDANATDHQAIRGQYGIPAPDRDGLNEEQFKDSIRKLSLAQQANFLRELTRCITHGQCSAAMDGIWHKHIATVIRLASTNTNNLDALIMAIDYIYSMAHHGGRILDHFDEKSWLEQALNTRTLTSPANLLFHASPHIRELLTSASIGIPKHESVSLLQEIEVALQRWSPRLFGYSFQRGETPIDKDWFRFTLTCRLTPKHPNHHSALYGKPKQIYDRHMVNYHKWGDPPSVNHGFGYDYSQDKEGEIKIIGKVIGYKTIQLYWPNEENNVSPQKIISSEEEGAMQLAGDLIDAVQYKEIEDIHWHPIQGDPNPNS